MGDSAAGAITADGADTILRVYVSPRAGRSAVAGERQGAIWIKLAAPPVEGAANRALIELLAARLGVPPSALRIEAGATGRRKRVRIVALRSEQATARLLGGHDAHATW
jgi:uncharacterized protein (TIGR00251 family)